MINTHYTCVTCHQQFPLKQPEKKEKFSATKTMKPAEKLCQECFIKSIQKLIEKTSKHRG